MSSAHALKYLISPTLPATYMQLLFIWLPRLGWIEEPLVNGLYQTARLPWNLEYIWHKIPKLKSFSSRLAVVFAQSIEAMC